MTIFQLLYKQIYQITALNARRRADVGPFFLLEPCYEKKERKYGLLVKLIIKEHAFRVNIGYEAVFPVIRQKTEIREPGTGTFFAEPIVLKS